MTRQRRSNAELIAEARGDANIAPPEPASSFGYPTGPLSPSRAEPRAATGELTPGYLARRAPPMYQAHYDAQILPHGGAIRTSDPVFDPVPEGEMQPLSRGEGGADAMRRVGLLPQDDPFSDVETWAGLERGPAQPRSAFPHPGLRGMPAPGSSMQDEINGAQPEPLDLSRRETPLNQESLAGLRADTARERYSPLGREWGWLDPAAGFGVAALEAAGDSAFNPFRPMGADAAQARHERSLDRSEFMHRAGENIGPAIASAFDGLIDDPSNPYYVDRDTRQNWDFELSEMRADQEAANDPNYLGRLPDLEITVPRERGVRGAVRHAGSVLDDLWGGVSDAARDARYDYVLNDDLEEIARDRGDVQAADAYEAQAGQAAATDALITGSGALEFIPGVGLIDLAAPVATSALRTAARHPLELANVRVPDALLAPDARAARAITETTGERMTPEMFARETGFTPQGEAARLTPTAEGWRNTGLLAAGAGLGADAIDGELGDDPLAAALGVGSGLAFGRNALVPRAAGVAGSQAIRTLDDAPMGFDGAPQPRGDVIDADFEEIVPTQPQRRWEAAVRDPETGAVYTGLDHAEAIDAIQDDAVRARLDALYQSDPSFGGFNVNGQYMDRQAGLASMRDARRPVNVGEQVNRDGSVTPRDPIDWEAGIAPERSSMRDLGIGAAVGAGGGLAANEILNSEAVADDGEVDDDLGDLTLPILGAGLGMAGASRLLGRGGRQFARDAESSVGMSARPSRFDENVNFAIPEQAGGGSGTNRPRGRASGSARAEQIRRNERILELVNEMQPVPNVRTGAANPGARLGIRLDNGYHAIAERLRNEGFTDVTDSVVKGVVNRTRARGVAPTAREAAERSDEAIAADLGMSVERYRKLSARNNSGTAAAIGATGLTGATLLGAESADASDGGEDSEFDWELPLTIGGGLAALGGAAYLASRGRGRGVVEMADEAFPASALPDTGPPSARIATPREERIARYWDEDWRSADAFSAGDPARGSTNDNTFRVIENPNGPRGGGQGDLFPQTAPGPQQVYHGTIKDFAPEDINEWSHFGTQNAARDRINAQVDPEFRNENGPNARILPYEITGRRIHVGEEYPSHVGGNTHGDVTPGDVADLLLRGRHISQEEHAWATEPLRDSERVIGRFLGRDSDDVVRERIAELAARHDIGAIGYGNTVEDVGSTSYIVPNPRGNVRPVIERPNGGPSGTTQALIGGAGLTGALALGYADDAEAQDGKPPLEGIPRQRDPLQTPLSDEEIERLEAEYAQIYGSNPPEADEADRAGDEGRDLPDWALALPLIAGIGGGAIGRRIGARSAQPLARETAQAVGGVGAGGIVGASMGAYSEDEDFLEAAGLGAGIGLGGTVAGSLAREGARRGGAALEGVELPNLNRRPRAAELQPPETPGRFALPLDEDALERELRAGRGTRETAEQGERRTRPSTVSAEERLERPDDARGSLRNRLMGSQFGRARLEVMAREAGLPTDGTVKTLAQRLVDAARATPELLVRWRALYPHLGLAIAINAEDETLSR